MTRTARLASLLLLLAPSLVRAHPLDEAYDRTLVVRLTPRAVVVDYTLVVDGRFATVDVTSRMSLAEVRRVTGRDTLFDRYLPEKAEEIRAALLARLDGKTLTFSRTRSRWSVAEHLKCEYRFEAPWTLEAGKPHDFLFRDASFHEEKGVLDLSLAFDESLRVLKVSQPDDALKKKADLADSDRLRTATATFEWLGGEGSKETSAAVESERSGRFSLLDLLFETKRGLLVLLAFAFGLGAIHALTPGHGKTLVAAYLVGERGTLTHAVLLGVVTALTHTGAILLVAAVLPLVLPDMSTKAMTQLLGFIGGLLIAALGFWLLQRRLAGQADHFHIGGGHHHHHGHDHDHHHLPDDRPVGLWSLITLGISGGIVPCGEALALFLVALRSQQASRAFVLLLAFSAGLACVLVVIGIGVVSAKRLAVVRWGESQRLKRVVRVLPMLSALLITALGVWLCYDSIHGGSH